MSARYWSRTLLGILLVAGSVSLASLLIYDLTRIGSCGSDGTYVAVRPCPDGTGWKIFGLIVSIFVAPFAGLALIATRGARGGGSLAGTIGVLWFFLLFTCMGLAALVSADGPAAPHDGTASASRWVAGTFLVMGLPALLGILWVSVRRRSRS